MTRNYHRRPQQIMNSSSKESTTKSSTTSSRIAKTTSSQRVHHITSSSSTSTISSSELKTSSSGAGFRSLQGGSIDIDSVGPLIHELKMPDNSVTITELKNKLKSSIENLCDGDDDQKEPLITFPDGTPTEELQLTLAPTTINVPQELTRAESLASLTSAAAGKLQLLMMAVMMVMSLL